MCAGAAEKTWLDDLNKAFMPCYPTTDGKAFDFPKLQWYHDGVAWCLKNKLMTNHKDGTFGVSETASRATRAETAVMITRFHVAMERSQKESLCRFPDEAGGMEDNHVYNEPFSLDGDHRSCDPDYFVSAGNGADATLPHALPAEKPWPGRCPDCQCQVIDE